MAMRMVSQPIKRKGIDRMIILDILPKSRERLLSYRDNEDEENTKESTKVAEEVLNANLKTKVIEK